jgi:hypothetical protein
MDLREQLTALLLGNAPHENVVGATAVEIPFHHRVTFSQPHYALCKHMIFRKDIFLQVVPDLGDPCIGTTLSYCCGAKRLAGPSITHTVFSGL